jgi:hypothetical protein
MKLRLLLLCGLLTTTAPHGASAKGLEKQSIVQASKDGVLMFTAPEVPGDYQFMFSPYVAGSDTVRGSEFVAVDSNDILASEQLGTLQMHRMPPGIYVIRIVTMQYHWGACLSENTFKFDINPGQITYIGRVDPRPTLHSILAEAARTGKMTSAGGQLRLFKDGMAPPVITFEGAAPSEVLLALAKANGFKTDSAVVSQRPVATRFRRTDVTGMAYCK